MSSVMAFRLIFDFKVLVVNFTYLNDHYSNIIAVVMLLPCHQYDHVPYLHMYVFYISINFLVNGNKGLLGYQIHI